MQSDVPLVDLFLQAGFNMPQARALEKACAGAMLHPHLTTDDVASALFHWKTGRLNFKRPHPNWRKMRQAAIDRVSLPFADGGELH